MSFPTSTPHIDLTDDNLKKGNQISCNPQYLPTLHKGMKRRLSGSVSDNRRDQGHTDCSILDQTLLPTQISPTWNFRGLKNIYGVSKAHMLPQPQEKISSSTSSQSPVELGSKLNRASANLENPLNHSILPDVQILGDPSQIGLNRPTKRRQQFLDLTVAPVSPSVHSAKHSRKMTQSDYLSDADFESYLEKENRENSIDLRPNLLPDSVQDIIDLEEDEVAEVAEEIENEDCKDFMSAPAIDEDNEALMNVIEISSDDNAEPSEYPQSEIRKKRSVSIQNIDAKFERLHISLRISDQLEAIQYGSHTYKLGDGVEFYNGTFMRIKTIYRAPKGNVVFSGPLLTRNYLHCLDNNDRVHTRILSGGGSLNELIWTISIDGRSKKQGEVVERELNEVWRPREIHFTNQTWPSSSCQLYSGGFKQKSRKIFEQGPLFCRWKRIKQLQVKNIGQEYEDCVMRLSQTEADPKYRQAPTKLRYAWRRVHVPVGGGSAIENQQFALGDYGTTTKTISKYSFADCFCGSGGASRGADLAGLVIKWALDHDAKAVKSYLANFSSTNCYQEDVDAFLTKHRTQKEAAKLLVDILHLSPPCQAFSLARTRGSEEAKHIIESVLTSTGLLLKLAKPRIATMEETVGLYWAHRKWMAMAIREMTDQGYSVKWKIFNSENYGVPQTRKRLIIVAAGPGEKLPPWPTPTHGPGLKPLATIQDRIQHIPVSSSHHRVISQFKNGPKASYSSYTQARTITCSGGDDAKNYHPDGLRPFTVRELACLQTFPVMHSFADANLTTAKRQIGNAVPPVLARALFRAIIESLKETDMNREGN